MVIVAYKAAGLQSVDKCVLFLKVPYLRLFLARTLILVPNPVKPYSPYRTIICEEFGELGIYEVHIMAPGAILAFRTAGAATCTAEGIVIGATPVQMGVVEVEFQAFVGKGGGKFPYHIPAERAGIHDIVRAGFTLEH